MLLDVDLIFHMACEAIKATRLFKAVFTKAVKQKSIYLKNMNPQQLADILLQDGKTLSSSGN